MSWVWDLWVQWIQLYSAKSDITNQSYSPKSSIKIPRQQRFVTLNKLNGNGNGSPHGLESDFFAEPSVPEDEIPLKRKLQFDPEDIPGSPPHLDEDEGMIQLSQLYDSCAESEPPHVHVVEETLHDESQSPSHDEKSLEDALQPAPKTPVGLDLLEDENKESSGNQKIYKTSENQRKNFP